MRLYQKMIRKSSKFMAHDEENKCRVGDRVLIRETRPISKNKSWRVVAIHQFAQQAVRRVKFMIQMRTILTVADNSGAKRISCILPLGGSTGRYRRTG